VKPAIPLIVLSLLGMTALSACRTYPDYSNDFRFPIEQGDISQGRDAFVRLNCVQCHTVAGVEFPDYTGTPFLSVPLGGDLIFAKTYGDLATSIINPNHELAEAYLDQLPAERRRVAQLSPMYVKLDMKVTELVDIVAFLNSRYALLPGYTEYYY
jgi:L-cysteine S-thiosulfotransferase